MTDTTQQATSVMLEKMIMAGFGGQGLLFMGKLMAQIMMEQGKHVTYFPSYGAEVRGGTANCHIIISDEEIYSPVADRATSLILMNDASYKRFAKQIAPGGLLFINSSMIAEPNLTPPEQTIAIAATDEAHKLGNCRVANMVMLGAYIERSKITTLDHMISRLPDLLEGRKAQLLDINIAALKLGQELVA